MTEDSSKTFYYAISQKRIQAAIKGDKLPGLTKSMFIPEGKGSGIWLSDSFALVFEQRYGEEYSSRAIGNTGLQQGDDKRVKAPIILVLEGIDERNLMRHPLSDSQFFYEGDLGWDKVKGVCVSSEDKEAVGTAQEIVEYLKAKGSEVELTEFSESFFRESLRAKPQKENRLATEGLIIKSFNEFKEGKEGKL